MTREEAIELLEDVIGFVEDNQGRDYDTAFRMAIETLSAEARPKGEWGKMRNWRDGSFYSRCSECGYFDDERDDLTAYNFCPYCGADMRGDESDE